MHGYYHGLWSKCLQDIYYSEQGSVNKIWISISDRKGLTTENQNSFQANFILQMESFI